jgi:transcriptional regulator with XRE-family HTH domain
MRDSSKRLYVAFGELVVAHRRRWKGGLTQAELGRRIGLSRTSVTNIEQGRHSVSLDTFLRIAAALDVEPEALLPPSPGEAGPSRMAKILPEGSPSDLVEWADSL